MFLAFLFYDMTTCDLCDAAFILAARIEKAKINFFFIYMFCGLGIYFFAPSKDKIKIIFRKKKRTRICQQKRIIGLVLIGFFFFF